LLARKWHDHHGLFVWLVVQVKLEGILFGGHYHKHEIVGSCKLQGLALYTQAHSTAYRRIESVAEVKGKLRVLDLTRDDVRKAIADAKDAAELYVGGLAGDYE
jgi:hypothetical protein